MDIPVAVKKNINMLQAKRPFFESKFVTEELQFEKFLRNQLVGQDEDSDLVFVLQDVD